MNAPCSSILDGLNPPQREAVETLDGPLLILAGAGSGKTRVVTRRIANLIEHGVPGWRILAITFTNKAAGEMRRRVEDLAGARGVWLSTFHSFCARLLRREAGALGLSRDFSIYDTDDTQKVLKEILKELHLEDKRYAPGRVRSLISHLKSRSVAPDELEGGSFHERMVRKIYREYERLLAHNQALDFDDLLLKGAALLREHEEVRERYRERFRYLLVDEYQDTNGCQYQLVKLLGQGHRNVCATGDPDQSIYAWRGADVRNILSFEKDFPEAKIVRLEQNYRSTKRILAVAQAVIEHNAERKERGLWTENPEGPAIPLLVAEDGEREAYEVARRIAELQGEGRTLNQIAVFYRTNAQSRPLENALIQAALPYQLVGGTPFYERREVKDVLAYLRLCVNPKDDVSFMRIVNVPKRGLGASSVRKIAVEAARRGSSLLEALDEPQWMERELTPRARRALHAFARMMDSFRAMDAYPVQDAVMRVIEESGLRAALKEAEEGERVENLDQLVNAAAIHDREHVPPEDDPGAEPPEPGAFDGPDEEAGRAATVAGFLENAALMTNADARREDLERVTLMTLHMAKGLEFPFVFLCGLEEGLLPLLRGSFGAGGEEEAYDPEAESRALEEERRLFYVGVTRAKERLFLLRAEYRMKYGRTEGAIPSRFLDEIPEALLEVEDQGQPAWARTPSFGGGGYGGGGGGRRRKKKSMRPAAASFEEFDRELALDSDTEYSQLEDGGMEVGERVRHPKFGLGRIESFSGSGLARKAVVYFRQHGKKQLLLSLAKLRKA